VLPDYTLTNDFQYCLVVPTFFHNFINPLD